MDVYINKMQHSVAIFKGKGELHSSVLQPKQGQWPESSFDSYLLEKTFDTIFMLKNNYI